MIVACLQRLCVALVYKRALLEVIRARQHLVRMKRESGPITSLVWHRRHALTTCQFPALSHALARCELYDSYTSTVGQYRTYPLELYMTEWRKEEKGVHVHLREDRRGTEEGHL